MLERLLHQSPDVEMEFFKSDHIFLLYSLDPEPQNKNIAKEHFKTEVLSSTSQAGLSILLSK